MKKEKNNNVWTIFFSFPYESNVKNFLINRLLTIIIKALIKIIHNLIIKKKVEYIKLESCWGNLLK